MNYTRKEIAEKLGLKSWDLCDFNEKIERLRLIMKDMQDGEKNFPNSFKESETSSVMLGSVSTSRNNLLD